MSLLDVADLQTVVRGSRQLTAHEVIDRVRPRVRARVRRRGGGVNAVIVRFCHLGGVESAPLSRQRMRRRAVVAVTAASCRQRDLFTQRRRQMAPGQRLHLAQIKLQRGR